MLSLFGKGLVMILFASVVGGVIVPFIVYLLYCMYQFNRKTDIHDLHYRA